MALPQALRNLDILFDESGGGFQVTGDSGTGKSSLMALLMQTLTLRGQGYALLDPHGDLCRLMEEFCANLPDRLRHRVVIIHPADTRKKLAGVNPLRVCPEGLDQYTWRARVLKKCAHAGHLLLHAWGERDFNSRPNLFKFTSWFTETLGLAGLTLPDVRAFFDPTNSLYDALTRVAPDAIAQLELSALAEMRFRDREELWGSTKNRFLGLLKNEIVEFSLGKLDPVLDARQLIRDGNFVLINLEPGGVLRDEDREILANTWAWFNCG